MPCMVKTILSVFLYGLAVTVILFGAVFAVVAMHDANAQVLVGSAGALVAAGVLWCLVGILDQLTELAELLKQRPGAQEAPVGSKKGPLGAPYSPDLAAGGATGPSISR